MSTIAIDGRSVGPGERPYLIAEMSANHGGDLERGKRIIRLAAAAGADAVKLQAYTADDLTIDADGPGFRLESGLWAGETLYELYQRAATPYAWMTPFLEEARAAGVTAFATPFSAAAVEHLASLDVPAFKIASFETVDLDLVRAAASTGKPMIISTGMCSADEIGAALDAARSAGASQITLLKCTSAYPAEPSDQNLITIPDMAERFGVPIGFSDHTIGNASPIAAVALGAALVEKHFIDTREPETADSAFSCLPDELSALRRDVDSAWAARGEVRYSPSAAELPSLVYRRSLYVVAPLARGEVIETRHVRSIRPGHGLAPRYARDIIGRRAARDVERGEPVSWSMVEDTSPPR
jgi:pseudaminic acid synthase